MELDKDKTATIQAPNKKGGKSHMCKTCTLLGYISVFEMALVVNFQICPQICHYDAPARLSILVNIYPFFGGSCQ